MVALLEQETSSDSIATRVYVAALLATVCMYIVGENQSLSKLSTKHVSSHQRNTNREGAATDGPNSTAEKRRKENIEEEITINPDLQMQEINFGRNTSTKFPQIRIRKLLNRLEAMTVNY